METGTVPVLDALAALETALDHAQKAIADGLWQLPESDLVGVLDRVHTMDGPFCFLTLSVVREIDTRGVPAARGASSLQAYLAGRLRLSPGQAREHARLSEALATRNAATGAALADGRIGREQARAISDTLDGLPGKTAPEDRDWAEEFLLTKARLFDARELRRLGRKLDEVIDPDGTPDREDAARSRRGLHIKDNHDGTQSLRWTDTDENLAFLKAALDALGKPLPGEDGERDPRPAPVRHADAMVDFVRRALDSGEFDPSRGVRPHLHVTFTAGAMRGEPGAPPPRTATGDHISPSVLRRLLCDASVTGILVDGHGVPLKVGRTKRTATPGQWVALVARDGGCAFPGCTRPPMCCQAHHFPEWAGGGATDLDKMGLFCTVHHRYLHDKGWRAQLGADGHVEVVPPVWIDPLQRPRRNWHWHVQRDPATNEPPDRGP